MPLLLRVSFLIGSVVLAGLCLLAWQWLTMPASLYAILLVLLAGAAFTVAFVALKQQSPVSAARQWLLSVHDADVGYALYRRDGVLIDCNGQFARLCHQDVESLLRSDVHQNIFKHESAIWSAIHHALMRGESWLGKLQMGHQSIEVRAFPLVSFADRNGPHLVLELRRIQNKVMSIAEAEVIVDRLPIGVVRVRDNVLDYVNDGFAQLLGTTVTQLQKQNLAQVLGQHNGLVAWLSVATTQLKTTEVVEAEIGLARSDSRVIWCQIKACWACNGRPESGVLLIVIDASEARKRQERLRQAAVVFEAASDSILILDAERRVRMVNAAFTRVTGYEGREVVGRAIRLLFSNKQPAELYEHIFSTADQKNSWQGEIWSRKKDGMVYPEWVNVNAVRNESGQVVEFVVIASDITERKRAEERLHYQANYDGLTNLPNRSLFIDRLRQSIARARREDAQLAILFVDLDRFKHVNDSMGHSAGDKLLVEVSKALRSCLRESDTISRFGGDEFAIILSPIYGPKNAGTVAQTLLKVLSRPFSVNGAECLVGGSIGICIFPGDGQNPEELVKNADAAMYRAKDEGRNTYQYFTVEMQQQALARIGLERDLRYAIDRQEFLLLFQPQVHVATQKISGLEVLIRWSSAKRGIVSPVEFISLAEENGQIVQMGEWVLRQACMQFVTWMREGLAPPMIAVNVSGRQLRSDKFVAMVRGVLDATQMPPEFLELELTESFLMEDETQVMHTLNELRGLGLHLSVDDFGTGYSSLSYLKRFPISTLKIDKSFVQDVPGDDEDVAIVAAILKMATALKLQVVAEGVETAEQLRYLREMQCDIVQGYFFSRPLSTADCTAYLARHRDGVQLASISEVGELAR